MNSWIASRIFPHGPAKQVPLGSKMDPRLTKTEPINNVGTIHVITYLRRGKSYCEEETGAREAWGHERETDPSMGVRRSGRRCYGRQSRFPCSPWWRSGWCRLSLQPMEVLAVAGRCAWEKAVTMGSPWPFVKPVLEQAPGRTCCYMDKETHTGAGFLAWLVAP